MKEQVILVAEFDNQIGTEEKLKAHRDGKLHRAFSIFLFNDKNELLLQKRAMNKYHSSGLWSNTCCGHPRPDEELKEAAERRLWEEMKINAIFRKSFDFIYKAKVTDELTEYEYDHVFIGHYGESASPNPDEVMEHRWLEIQKIRNDLLTSPKSFTIWFKMVWETVAQNWPQIESSLLQRS